MKWLNSGVVVDPLLSEKPSNLSSYLSKSLPLSCCCQSLFTSIPLSFMAGPLVPLSAITLQSKQWTVKVLLVEKSSRRPTRIPGLEFQRYIFTDDTGDKVQAISYTPDTAVVDRVVETFKTYLISNAKVTECPDAFRFVNNSVQWVLTSATVMEVDTICPYDVALACPHFTPFASFNKYIGSPTNIDVLGLAIDRSSPRTINAQNGPSIVQDMVLVSAEKLPVVLSLWNDLIHNEGALAMSTSESFPVVAALRVRVQTFRATALHNWRSNNLEYLRSLVHAKPYFNGSTNATSVDIQLKTTIAQLITSPAEGHYTVTGKIILLDDANSYYYIACPTCYHQTTAFASQEFTCHECVKKQVAHPRAKFPLLIYDNLTQLEIVGFGHVAEMTVGVTATEIIEGNIDFKRINQDLEDKDFDLQVRKKLSKNNTNNYAFYTLVRASAIMPQTISNESSFSMQDMSSPNTQDMLPDVSSNKRCSPVSAVCSTIAHSLLPLTELEHLSRKCAKLSSDELIGRANSTDHATDHPRTIASLSCSNVDSSKNQLEAGPSSRS